MNTQYIGSPKREDGSIQIADSVDGDKECCGWLWIRSSKLRRWKYCYFSLKSSVLTYYDKFPAEEYFSNTSRNNTSGSQHMDGARARGVLRVAHVEEMSGNNLGFKIYGTSGKIIDLRAAKANIRGIWMRAFLPSVRRLSRAWSHDGSTSSGGSIVVSDDGLPPTSILKAGWMLKQSDIIKQWRKYYFVLQNDMISYYTSDKPYDVPRRRGYVMNVTKSPQSRGGLVIHLNSGSELHVVAENYLENDAWFASLMASIKLRNSQKMPRFESNGTTYDDDRDFSESDSDDM